MLSILLIAAQLHSASSIYYIEAWIRHNNERPIQVQEIPPIPMPETGPTGNQCRHWPKLKGCKNG